MAESLVTATRPQLRRVLRDSILSPVSHCAMCQVPCSTCKTEIRLRSDQRTARDSPAQLSDHIRRPGEIPVFAPPCRQVHGVHDVLLSTQPHDQETTKNGKTRYLQLSTCSPCIDPTDRLGTNPKSITIILRSTRHELAARGEPVNVALTALTTVLGSYCNPTESSSSISPSALRCHRIDGVSLISEQLFTGTGDN